MKKIDRIYVEAELVKEQKYEPKDGDFIHLKWKVVSLFPPFPSEVQEEEREAIAIFKEINETYNNLLYCYVTYFVDDDFKGNPTLMVPSDYIGNKISNGYTSTFDEIRPATEIEKTILINQLAKVNKKWNPETKRIEDVRWRAVYETEYFYIDNYCNVIRARELNERVDELRSKLCNYFKTREAAEKAAEQIREIFKNSKSE